MTIKEVTFFLVCLFSLANSKDVQNVLNKCTAEKPCEVNAGDCTFDDECRGNLICTKNNCVGSTLSLNAKCCQEPEQPIKVNSGPCKDKKGTKKCKKLKKKEKCKKKKVWKKCKKTCEKCDDSGCPGNQVPNTNKPEECVCPGELVVDSNNSGECICPGNKIPDGSNLNQCSCPANQIPDSNDPTQCLCPNGQLPNMTRQCASAGTKVMITTGHQDSSARKTEVVDVVSGESCADLADFPLVNDGAVGATLNGTPIVCGGFSDGAGKEQKTCYKYTNAGWQQFASMKKARWLAAGVIFKNKFHVFGGWGGTGTSGQKSEIISIDGLVEYGPDLPKSVARHAITFINSTVSIMSGGSFGNPTWFLNHETNVFSSGPSLLKSRERHGSATIVDKVTQAKIPIVAGGWNDGRLDSTELLIQGEWQSGPVLPKALCCFSMVEIQGDAYLFGGNLHGNIYNKAIYQLTCSSGICSWSTINQELKYARYETAAFAVPDHFCT